MANKKYNAIDDLAMWIWRKISNFAHIACLPVNYPTFLGHLPKILPSNPNNYSWKVLFPMKLFIINFW